MSAAAHHIRPDAGKLLTLDGVRAFAVLAVMASHFARFVPDSAVALPWKSVAGYGWVGVALFFALSGFLITGILLETRDSPNYFQAFYARRTLRIFPIYYLTLIAVFAAASFFPSGLSRVPAPADRAYYFLFLTNWLAVWRGSWPPNVLGHFWSLAVEEQFYIFWPMVVLFVSRLTLKRLCWALAGCALMVRIVTVATHGPSDSVNLGTFTRIDGLALGALAACVFAERKDARDLHLGWAAAVSLGAFCAILAVLPSDPARQYFYETAGYSLLAVGCAALVLLLAFTDSAGGAVQRFFRYGPLRKIGLYSYGMYVYHVPVLGLCELLLFDHLPAALRANLALTLAYVVFLGVVTFGVAMASYEVLERPVLRLKRYFVPNGRPQGSVRAAEQVRLP